MVYAAFSARLEYKDRVADLRDVGEPHAALQI